MHNDARSSEAMTTTRKTLETDKVRRAGCRPATEQQGKAMDEAVAACALPGATQAQQVAGKGS